MVIMKTGRMSFVFEFVLRFRMIIDKLRVSCGRFKNDAVPKHTTDSTGKSVWPKNEKTKEQ